jgi:Glycosyl hydrolase family 26
MLPAARADAVRPVADGASPEATALLQLVTDVSGRYLLTGQHNFPNVHDRNSVFAAAYTGKAPVIFGSDWGHAKAGDTDSYLARPDIVKEAIRQHQQGAIVTLCWHAIPPTSDEPGTFRPLPGADPRALASVQGRLPDDQFRDILTPGTRLYERWCAQVDAVAGFLKQLRDAHVPVLWRPYHEMNGDWFWWGGRPGPDGTRALYRQMFERYNRVHHLNNLVWVWSVDRPKTPERQYAGFFPGLDCVDVLALDVYGADFRQSYYDSLIALAGPKPVALAEVGTPPDAKVLSQQPRWAYYMIWSGMVHNTPHAQYDAMAADGRFLGLGDPAYAEVSRGYRAACGLGPLSASRVADFSGSWALDEERSDFGPSGPSITPVRLDVTQSGGSLTVRSTQLLEYADDQVHEETFPLGGTEVRYRVAGSERTTRARLSPTGDAVIMETSLSAPWIGPGATLALSETWTLAAGGRRITVERVALSPKGSQRAVLVYDRR